MKKNGIWMTLFVLLLACTTIGGIGTRTTFGEDLPEIYVDPSTSTVSIGQFFTIDLSVANVTIDNSDNGIYGWECDVSFDPNVLEATSVMEGPFLSDVWYTTWFYTPPKINNTAGTIISSNAFLGYPTTGALGDGVLANVTFKATAVGATTLHFYKTVLNTYYQGNVSSIDHTRVDGSANVASGHDVAVVSVAAPIEAASSSIVSINVTVKNEGSFTEVANVTVRYDSTYIGSQNTTLTMGENQTLSFSWNTMGLSKGTYPINATATIPVDNDPTDNSKTTTIRIVEHDVAVTDVDAPSTAKVGAIVPIDVTVENQGSHTEVANVTVRHDSTLIGFNDTVSVNAGTYQNVSFNWNTIGLLTGIYTITANATISVDDDPTDNSKNATIELELLHDVAVINLTAPTDAPAGSLVSIDVTVENEGDFPEVANVTIHYDSTYIDSQNLALSVGENKTAEFTWNTAGVTPDRYWIRANATIPVEDDPEDNWDERMIRLTVHDVAVVDIEAPPKGYTNYDIIINVTVMNEGDFREMVNVTLKYDGAFIENKTVEVIQGLSKVVSFTWNTIGVTPGNYNLTATATVLESMFNLEGIDDDPADNTLDDVTVFVTIAGDVDGDGTVDDSDLSDLNEAFGSEPGDTNWDSDCDINGDKKVDASDLFDLSKNYGKSI